MVWTQTYSGRAFTPLDPRPEDVELSDIAHALSLQCRFNGHCRFPYSVAQHSVYVACQLPPAMAPYGIIHDAAEAYLGDMVRPVKSLFPLFSDLEDRVLGAICAAVGLPWPWSADVLAAVKSADNAVLAAECRQILGPLPRPWAPLPPPPVDLTIIPWEWQDARERWLMFAHTALPKRGMHA